MDEPITMRRVTVMLNRAFSGRILDNLQAAGVRNIHVAPARTHVIRERKGLFGIGFKERLVDTPSDILSFVVPPETAQAILNLVIDWGDLNLQGRGSAFCEEVAFPAGHEVFGEPGAIHLEGTRPPRTLQTLQKVCCIVQRGQGAAIAKVALYSGAGVPVVYFGSGTGVRDKMGLLRITIPAEKDIVVVGTTPHNCESVMDMMIDIGQLWQPGKGFVYTCPLEAGLADLRVSHGGRRHAATMEQVIAAIDRLRGDTAWRRWADGAATGRHKKRAYLTGLVDLTLFCNAGKGPELVSAAMAAGVSGATIHTYRHLFPSHPSLAAVGLSREACSMVIPAGLAPRVAEALRQAGAFTDQCFGQVQVRGIRKAFTYTPAV